MEDIKIQMAAAAQRQLERATLIRAIEDFHHKFQMRHEQNHTKDQLCLYCFNNKLAKSGWTYKPGERAVRVNRYVQGRTSRGKDFMKTYAAGGR